MDKDVREAAPDGEGNRASWRNKKAQDFTHFLIHKSTLLSTYTGESTTRWPDNLIVDITTLNSARQGIVLFLQMVQMDNFSHPCS